MENIYLSATNLVALLPIINNFKQHKYLHSFMLTFAMSSSMFYHLVQAHKHNMPGIGTIIVRYNSKLAKKLYNAKLEHNLLMLDRLGVSSVLFTYLLCNKNYNINYNAIMENMQNVLTKAYNLKWPLALSLGCMLMSESFHYCSFIYNKLNITNNQKKYMHVFFHSIWHITVFYYINYF